MPRQRSLSPHQSLGKPPLHPTLSHSTPSSSQYSSPLTLASPKPRLELGDSSSSTTTASQPLGVLEEPTPASPFTSEEPSTPPAEVCQGMGQMLLKPFICSLPLRPCSACMPAIASSDSRLRQLHSLSCCQEGLGSCWLIQAAQQGVCMHVMCRWVVQDAEDHVLLVDPPKFTCKSPADLAWHDIRQGQSCQCGGSMHASEPGTL